VLAASALAVSGTVALAGPAAADINHCQTVIKTSGLHTLDTNIGPCEKNGIIIEADNVVLDLQRHFVTGSNMSATGPNEQVGILFRKSMNSTVKNGIVQNFDAGVAIVGGSGNTVKNVTAQNNINHSNITGTINACNFGDGITVQDSSNNKVMGSKALNNGPFSGISVVGNADNNTVDANIARNNTASNENPAFVNADNPEGNGPCGPFSATPTGVGRNHQDIGIRIEGPGSNGNQVTNNKAWDNQLEGISIHGYVCLTGFPSPPPPGFPPTGTPNTNNLVQGNSVLRNGFAAPGEALDGIGVLRQGPFGNIVCASNDNTINGNTSSNNAHDGIYIPPTGSNEIQSQGSTINNNTVDNNGRDGIHLDGPFTTNTAIGTVVHPGANDNTLMNNNGHGNAAHDGFDGNVNCDNNNWVANLFGTVNQACVAANGGTGTVIGPIPV